jgi:hypothetical protein
MKAIFKVMQFLKRLDTLTTKFTPQSPPSYDQQLLDRAEVLARTVISQQLFYQSSDCSDKQRQLLETMVGAAIWYLPQGEDLWTGCISLQALSQLANAEKPKSVKLTKDHHFPRKVAAAELFQLDWTKIDDPALEVTQRYLNQYGCFNYVLPEENKKLCKYQRAHCFVSPKDSYLQAGIQLRKLSMTLLKAIRKGDRDSAAFVLSGAAA